MKIAVGLSMIVTLAALPAAEASAQERAAAQRPALGAFAGGAVWDFDSPPGFDTGYAVGIRGRYPLPLGLGATASLAFTRVNDIDSEGQARRDESLLLPLLGLDYAFGWPNTTFFVGLAGGVSRRKTDLPDVPGDGEFGGAYVTVAPSFAAEQRVRRNLSIRLQLYDVILTEMDVHNPALTLGLSLGL